MKAFVLALSLSLLTATVSSAEVIYSPAAQQRIAATEQPPAVVVTVPASKKKGRVERFCDRCDKWTENHPRTWGGVKFCAKTILFCVEVLAALAQASKRAII